MIIIPMAGRSSRFFDAGFTVHKYRLYAHGKSLFDHSILSFERYFDSELFLFVTLKEHCARNFIEDSLSALGVRESLIVELEEMTLGQADTVKKGIERAGVNRNEPITIFNIDTFRPGFSFPSFLDAAVDGYLETFIGEGKNWSNIVPGEDGVSVALTGEKQELSEFCCTGLYHFASAELFMNAYEAGHADSLRTELAEVYVAPLYNYLIDVGKSIRYSVVDRSEVIFCGTPDEYSEFLNKKW